MACRSSDDSEIVLINTKGGAFSFPDSLGINGASYGYFDKNNQWVKQGDVQYTKTSVTPPSGTTVRLTRADTKERSGKKIQAESVSFWGGSFLESKNIGFAGNGYINLGVKYGKIECTNIDGNDGGTKTIRFRYANAGQNAQRMRVVVNGVGISVSFPSTGSDETYKYVSVKAELKAGKTNSINLEASEDGNVNADELEIL